MEEMCIRPATLPERHTEFMMYVDFVNYYVGAVIGLRHFEKQKCRKLYREYVSVSDEAFAILTLENNWERWMEMARQDDWTTAAVPTKWTVTRDRTASAAKKAQNRESETGNPQARRYRGWSAQGINRYNQLFDQIEAERETSRATTFEDNLLRHFQREEAESNSKKRGGVPKEAPPMPIPRHELWANDTIVSNTRVQKAAVLPVRDEMYKSSSDEEDEEEQDELPDYSRSNGVRAHGI